MFHRISLNYWQYFSRNKDIIKANMWSIMVYITYSILSLLWLEYMISGYFPIFVFLSLCHSISQYRRAYPAERNFTYFFEHLLIIYVRVLIIGSLIQRFISCINVCTSIDDHQMNYLLSQFCMIWVC